MNTVRPVPLSEQNAVILPLAVLLQKLEVSAVAFDPAQYRVVANRLGGLLADARMDDTLQAILQAHPAAAELYENVHYAHAGLCRSSLDASLTAEKAARGLIKKASRAAS